MSFCQGSWPDCKIICKHFNTRFLGTEWLSLKPSSLGSLGDLKSFYKIRLLLAIIYSYLWILLK